jgi:prepilin-type N-terminal cleavage/methylation domain-containing protein
MKPILFTGLQEAFTLVELMITIVIIGILAAIGVPIYQNYVFKAKLVEAYHEIDLLSKSEATYFLDHKEFHYYDNLVTAGTNYPVGTLGAPGLYNGPISHPFPQGTAVLFWNQIIIGKTNSSGDDVVGLIGDNIYNPLPISHSGMDEHGNWCNIIAIAAAQLGEQQTIIVPKAENQPQYNWAVIIADRNFQDEEANNCTYLYRVIDTDSRGSIRGLNGPILSFNLGD